MELPGKRELREQILHQMDGRTSYVSDKDVYREIDKAILRSSHGGYGTLSEKEELRRQMFYSIRGFDVLEKYLGDSSISEIMVIGASRIFVEQNGKIRRIEEHFSEEGDVYRLIEQIVAPTNRMVNEACPIVDSRLPDGSRVHEKGFQNLLQSMMTSLQAGYSLNNSCRIALKELEELYQDQNNPMLRQMRRIIQGLDLHITLEQLFMEFAESTGLEEAKQFAVVIEIVRSTGGNMVEILKRTMQHLKYKMDTEEEIRVLLSGKLFEKNIMLSMPFFILLYLRLANPEYVECFYNTILGHLVMSGMIGITVFCFFWSEKIMNIRF